MALKAGRRGLHKRLVDAFGNLNGEAPSGDYYTKQQTDNKFETKTHVNNTFQKKTLEVPLEMLSGSKLTVEEALQGLNAEKFSYADNGVLGAKNLLPNNATSQTVNGVTFTVNSDGTITANGTATANITNYFINTAFSLKAGKYLISGTPNSIFSVVNNGVRISNGNFSINVYGDEDGTLFTLDNDTSGLKVDIRIASGVTVSNITFKPMLRLASDPDDTYVPYAMTNREITKELTVQESEVTDIVVGATISNNHNKLYKQGKFVHMCIEMAHVTATAYDTIIAKVPSNYKPRAFAVDCNMSNSQLARIYVSDSGSIRCRENLSDVSFVATATWVTE